MTSLLRRDRRFIPPHLGRQRVSGNWRRTSFAPEAISTKHNERDRYRTKIAATSTKLIDIPPLITVCLQVRVLPGAPEIKMSGPETWVTELSPMSRAAQNRVGLNTELA